VTKLQLSLTVHFSQEKLSYWEVEKFETISYRLVSDIQ